MVAALLLTVAAFQEPTSSETINARAAAVLERTAEAIPKAEAWAKNRDEVYQRVRRGRINARLTNTTQRGGRVYYPSRDAKEEAVEKAKAAADAAEARVEALKSGEAFDFGEFYGQPGEFGRLRGKHFTARQVIPGEGVLAEIGVPTVEYRAGIPIEGTTETDVMIVGLPESMVVADGKMVDTDLVFEAGGVYTYETLVGASRTVPKIRPIDADPIIEKAKELAESR
ncbi:hypothetical protein [Alienimonas sp. DA493]|uniref:hypothetical protein n=1 Tax=Alienimonas sp. DA493 TaxID=3373605 RepID=UPI0037548BF1